MKNKLLGKDGIGSMERANNASFDQGNSSSRAARMGLDVLARLASEQQMGETREDALIQKESVQTEQEGNVPYFQDAAKMAQDIVKLAGGSSDTSEPIDKVDHLAESKQNFEQANQNFNRAYNDREKNQKIFEVEDNLRDRVHTDWEHLAPNAGDRDAVSYKLNAYGTYINQLGKVIQFGKALRKSSEKYIECHRKYIECYKKYVESHGTHPQRDMSNISAEFQGNHSRWSRYQEALNGDEANLESSLENFKDINRSIDLEAKMALHDRCWQGLLEQRQKLLDQPNSGLPNSDQVRRMSF